MSKLKLTKAELERRKVVSVSTEGSCESLRTLVEKYGLDAEVSCEDHGYYDVHYILEITTSRLETDGEYDSRINSLLEQKKAQQIKAKKDKELALEKEKALYQKLKSKYEGC